VQRRRLRRAGQRACRREDVAVDVRRRRRRLEGVAPPAARYLREDDAADAPRPDADESLDASRLIRLTNLHDLQQRQPLGGDVLGVVGAGVGAGVVGGSITGGAGAGVVFQNQGEAAVAVVTCALEHSTLRCLAQVQFHGFAWQNRVHRLAGKQCQRGERSPRAHHGVVESGRSTPHGCRVMRSVGEAAHAA